METLDQENCRSQSFRGRGADPDKTRSTLRKRRQKSWLLGGGEKAFKKKNQHNKGRGRGGSDRERLTQRYLKKQRDHRGVSGRTFTGKKSGIHAAAPVGMARAKNSIGKPKSNQTNI